MRHIVWFIFLSILLGCSPVERPADQLPIVNFDDPDVNRILSFQDKRLTDSLIIYFQSASPNHRYLAAKAFASVQDKKAIPGLLRLLKDNNAQIRSISAFSLGQIGDPSAENGLTQAFEKNDSIQDIMLVNKEVLEALGKCGSEQSMKYIAAARNYGPEDIPLVQGQTRSLYRFGLREMTDSLGTLRMVDILSDPRFDSNSRLFAANYLYRFRNLDLSLHVGDLIKTYVNEGDEQIKLFLAVVLGRLNTDSALNQLLGDLESDSDPSLKCNIIRGLEGYPYERV
ncbi:MAG: HEAT repeat domain-containing protein, partial [Bacteroidia bacterium]|nr:HEAT repeat domain-containing protein [Bacteroidia bacterium]